MEQIKTGFPGQELGLCVSEVQSQDALAEHLVPAELKNQVEPLHKIWIGEFAFAAQDLDGSFNRTIVRTLGKRREEPDRPHVNDFAGMRKSGDSVLMQDSRNRF